MGTLLIPKSHPPGARLFRISCSYIKKVCSERGFLQAGDLGAGSFLGQVQICLALAADL